MSFNKLKPFSCDLHGSSGYNETGKCPKCKPPKKKKSINVLVIYDQVVSGTHGK
mgnify:CR=1 FL=1